MSTTINTTPIDIEITRTNNNVDVTTTPISIEVSNADRNVSVENKPIDVSIETTPIDVAVSTVGVNIENPYVRPYKVYTALLTQSGTNAPVPIIFENTLDGVPIWGYTSVGVYSFTLADAFTLNKTAVILGKIKFASVNFKYELTSTSVISISTATNNGMLENTFIEIRVYP